MSNGVDVYLVPPSGNEMGKFSVDLYKKLVRSYVDKWDTTNDSYFKKQPDSSLFKSGNAVGDPYYRKPEVEGAKQKVKIE